MNIGKISENILKRSVLKNIDRDKNVIVGAAAGADCAIVMEKENKLPIAVATGYVADEADTVSGAHAFCRAMNNLAANGYRGEYATVTLSVPEKWREIKLKELVRQMNDAAKNAGVSIVDGHSETVAGVSRPVVSVTAFSTKPLVNNCHMKKEIRPGQSIVMTKWAAMSGTAHLVRERRDDLATRLPAFILNDVLELEQFYSVIPEAAVAINSGATAMHDVTDGGIYAALWQLASYGGVGLTVNLHDIPIRQESVEVCEYFDINPYKLRSDGSMLIVTDDAEGLIEDLAKADIKGTVIGSITEGSDRVLISGEERRFLEEPRQDEIHNIL